MSLYVRSLLQSKQDKHFVNVPVIGKGRPSGGDVGECAYGDDGESHTSTSAVSNELAGAAAESASTPATIQSQLLNSAFGGALNASALMQQLAAVSRATALTPTAMAGGVAAGGTLHPVAAAAMAAAAGIGTPSPRTPLFHDVISSAANRKRVAAGVNVLNDRNTLL